MLKDGIYLHKFSDMIALKDSELFHIAYTLSYPSILGDLTLSELRRNWIWVCEY